MKILLVNNVFAQGSTGKILRDVHDQLRAEGHESVICYARQRGKINNPPHVYKFCTELEGDFWHAISKFFGHLPYSGMWFATRKLISIIEREKPDVVNLHCINDWSVNIYDILKYLGQHNIKTVVTHHAEFFYTGTCGHAFDCLKWTHNPGCGSCPQLAGTSQKDQTALAWQKMQKAFAYHSRENLLFTTVSLWVKSRLEMSPITNAYDCVVVENGVNDKVYHPYGNKCTSMKPVIFHASARFKIAKGDIKGGWYVFELARRMPQVQFKVACSLHGDLTDIPSNLEIVGSVQDPIELAKLYSEAKLMILTSQRETFSMTTAESLCCGTPVVGFKAGGPESIALPDFSEFVEYGDIDAMQAAVEKMLQTDYDVDQLATQAHQRYGANVMAKNYIEAYKKVL